MRISAIDIGTNTVLLLIADVKGNSLQSLVHGHAVARLGRGVDAQRNLSADSMERVARVLKEYIVLSKKHNAQHIVACGTSAVRDARNQKEFLLMVRERFGLDVKVLTGTEEAELTYAGVLSELFLDPSEPLGVLDIGGGSTEISLGEGPRIRSSVSLDIGCVRLTERFLHNTPPDPKLLEECVAAVQEHVVKIPGFDSAGRLVGVAGTVTTLAAIDLQLARYDPLRVGGHVLSLATIQRIFDRLKILNPEEIKAIPQVHSGRADILLAGIVVLMEVMKHLGKEEITASDRGLRYGLALREGK
jgi:exopolyphosphatase/guanosine-5'-triphosphate,3'-diphosphate pyrophosphatase